MQEGFPRPGDWRWRSLWRGNTREGVKRSQRLGKAGQRAGALRRERSAERFPEPGVCLSWFPHSPMSGVQKSFFPSF
ncbi:hypothetical protein [Scytonema sp. PRP1]|uniref:hypothetical protein n=1 Tax=Scytonema sp. PRP1 TaxID=3120513 RepID=UPI002FD790E0